MQRMERRSKEENLFTNFSHVVLTPDQVNLLNKGANFCPTRESVNKTEVKVSNFPPSWSHSAPADLKNCIAATQFDILSAPLKKVKPNLTRGNQEALKDLSRLQRDCKMVIRRSDKVGGWVLVDYNIYKEAGDS